MTRLRIILSVMVMTAAIVTGCTAGKSGGQGGRANIAPVATITSSMRGGQQVTALNDGLTPNQVTPEMRRALERAGNNRRPMPSSVWYEYEWQNPVTINEVDLFWSDFEKLMPLPQSYDLKYWNGTEYVPVNNPSGLGLVSDEMNVTTFDKVKTNKLRLEINSPGRLGTLLEWQVFQPEGSPAVAPVVNAGIDRDVIKGGRTYLSGTVKALDNLDKTRWSAKGPGKVEFEDAGALVTTATFIDTGNYVLTLTAKSGRLKSSSSLNVKVVTPPESKRLEVVYTTRYKIDSPFWNARARAIIVDWIPWCIDQINRKDLTKGMGGIDNFMEAAKALRGEPHGPHKGFVFSNAWVHQTVESMSIALMVDPQGDPDIIKAQEKMKKTLQEWIPIILSAQEPDGYLQTAYTLRDTTKWKERWSPANRANHEGYTAGYFIESAINYYTLTDGTDKRLYDAAKKLADCWVANIGPGKKEWYDGHQEMEQALVRFGRFVNDVEGNGRGDDYIKLAKFLLDSRKNGSEYDQSHVPVIQQYEAVGHAVRAAYTYSGMADVAAETGDMDYESAVMSLWDNIVNKKYYITGGIGSGETSEGFGPDYSLRNNSYCESCSSCGLIFFEYKMNLAYHDAKYADLYEETMYNALLGSLDLEGKNFYYTNALSSGSPRYSWHNCPCCVGNIPRTLLMIPTWTYVKDADGIYVNMFVGSTIDVGKVAGTELQMEQKTNYPWSGEISIIVNPEDSKEFTLYVRVPNRTTSALYTPVPQVSGLKSLSVNGETIKPEIVKGYAVIKRVWKKGDKVDLVLPMEIQKVTADARVEADRDRVALRYGPLVYNVEKADNQDINKSLGNGPLSLNWRPDLLQGVMTIDGTWSDGSPMVAIPNYARNNRGPVPEDNDYRDPSSIVWIKK